MLNLRCNLQYLRNFISRTTPPSTQNSSRVWISYQPSEVAIFLTNTSPVNLTAGCSVRADRRTKMRMDSSDALGVPGGAVGSRGSAPGGSSAAAGPASSASTRGASPEHPPVPRDSCRSDVVGPLLKPGPGRFGISASCGLLFSSSVACLSGRKA